jgi:hypothetical protein
MTKLCPCGSGLPRRELVDAAGIFCTFVCDKCEAEKRAKFRPQIFDAGTDYAASGEEADLDNDRRNADRIDGYDRDDLGESPDW